MLIKWKGKVQNLVELCDYGNLLPVYEEETL